MTRRHRFDDSFSSSLEKERTRENPDLNLIWRNETFQSRPSLNVSRNWNGRWSARIKKKLKKFLILFPATKSNVWLLIFQIFFAIFPVPCTWFRAFLLLFFYARWRGWDIFLPPYATVGVRTHVTTEELHRPGTIWRTLYQLSYPATAAYI